MVLGYALAIVWWLQSSYNDFNPTSQHPIWVDQPQTLWGPMGFRLALAFGGAALVAHALWRALRAAGLRAFAGWRVLWCVPLVIVGLVTAVCVGGVVERVAKMRAYARYVEETQARGRSVASDWIEVRRSGVVAWDGRFRSSVVDLDATLAELAGGMRPVAGQWLCVEVEGGVSSDAVMEVLEGALRAGITQLVFAPSDAGSALPHSTWVELADAGAVGLAVFGDGAGAVELAVASAGERVAVGGAPVRVDGSFAEALDALRKRQQAAGAGPLERGGLLLGAGVAVEVWLAGLRVLDPEGAGVRLAWDAALGS